MDLHDEVLLTTIRLRVTHSRTLAPTLFEAKSPKPKRSQMALEANKILPKLRLSWRQVRIDYSVNQANSVVGSRELASCSEIDVYIDLLVSGAVYNIKIYRS